MMYEPDMETIWRYSHEGQHPVAVLVTLRGLTPILLIDEEIVYIAVQVALNDLLPGESIVLTNRRLIRYKHSYLPLTPPLLESFFWRDGPQVRIGESALGPTVQIQTQAGELVEIPTIPAPQAHQIGQFLQDWGTTADWDLQDISHLPPRSDTLA
jgi:hypothetical protein